MQSCFALRAMRPKTHTTDASDSSSPECVLAPILHSGWESCWGSESLFLHVCRGPWRTNSGACAPAADTDPAETKECLQDSVLQWCLA
jgi:hypothetical protein